MLAISLFLDGCEVGHVTGVRSAVPFWVFFRLMLLTVQKHVLYDPSNDS